MKLIPALLLLLLALSSQAQIDTTKRNALFLSFEEFRNNTPAFHPVDIYMEEESEGRYFVRYRADSNYLKKYRHSFWGFSDSTDVYIRYKGSFGRFIEIGKICVFRFLPGVEYYAAVSELFKPYNKKKIANDLTSKLYIMNFDTGEVYELKPKFLKELIKDNSEILAEFNSESEYNRNRDQLLYIRKYNGHKAEH